MLEHVSCALDNIMRSLMDRRLPLFIQVLFSNRGPCMYNNTCEVFKRCIWSQSKSLSIVIEGLQPELTLVFQDINGRVLAMIMVCNLYK